MLVRMWPAAIKREVDIKMRKEAAERELLENTKVGQKIHLLKLADMLTPDATAIARAWGEKALKGAGLTDVGKSLKPRQATLRFVQAIKRGHNVRELLEIWAKLLSIENRKHSLAVTVAAISHEKLALPSSLNSWI